MLTAALVLFAVAAIGGIVLLVQRLRGDGTPALPLAVVHGVVAATALVLLMMAILAGASSGLFKGAAILFVVAALGGFVLFAQHLRKQQLPVPLILGHGLIAVVAFVLLGYAWL